MLEPYKYECEYEYISYSLSIKFFNLEYHCKTCKHSWNETKKELIKEYK